MNKNLTSIFCILVFLLVLIVSPNVEAQTTMVYIDPPVTRGLLIGEAFPVNVTVSNVINLFAWEFQIYYKSEILNASNWTPGPVFLPPNAVTFNQSWADNYNKTHGMIHIVCTLEGQRTFNGTATLATVYFRVKSLGTTPLTLQHTMLVDNSEPFPQEITHNVADGTVRAGDVVNINLFGSASNGWGFTLGNMTSPGPTIVATKGYLVNLSLNSADGLSHRFFVDYNSDGNLSLNEPASPEFQTKINYQFNATTIGAFSYYCEIHPSVMRGTFIIQPQIVSIHLFGSLGGWGLAGDDIASPGPAITVEKGDLVNLTLTSADSVTHNFFVDYNKDALPSVDEPISPDFQATINFQFNATQAGNFTYYCQYHKEAMRGNFLIQGSETLSTDLNGDGVVNILDISIVAKAFNSKPGNARWNPVADIDKNGTINIIDVSKVAKDFGKKAGP